MSARLLCAGRMYCDLVFTGAPRLPSLGTEVFCDGLSLHAGGGAFITAATLSTLGHSVAQCSVLPAMPFETVIRDHLSAHNVDDTPTAPAAHGSDPQITVAITGAEDRAFLTRMDGPALPPLDTVNFAAFSHLHIGELKTLQDNPSLIERARANGLTISLDCGWQDSFAPNARALIAKVDIFLPNESEAAAIGETQAALTVVKCGPKGAKARANSSEDWLSVPTSPYKVLDPTGAGDAFNGGFLSAWLSGAPLSDCLENGNRCGGATVQAVGGTGGLGLLRKQTSQAAQ